MNYLINDLGVNVIAEGAPGSLARIRCQFPGLISRLQLRDIDQTAQEMIRAGIESKMEAENLVWAVSEQLDYETCWDLSMDNIPEKVVTRFMDIRVAQLSHNSQAR